LIQWARVVLGAAASADDLLEKKYYEVFETLSTIQGQQLLPWHSSCTASLTQSTARTSGPFACPCRKTPPAKSLSLLVPTCTPQCDAWMQVTNLHNCPMILMVQPQLCFQDGVE
jgi:hypothetical protein